MPIDDARPRWRMLAILLWLMTLTAGGVFSVAPLGPLIMDDLGISKGQFGLLSSSAMLAGLFTTFAVGILIDRTGIRPIILVACTVMGACLAAFFFVPPTFLAAYVLLFFVGIGFSPITPLTNAGIMQWFPPRERGLAIGIKQCGMSMGTALGASILPALALLMGWKGALGMASWVILATGALAWLFFRDRPAPDRLSPDHRPGQPEPARAAVWQLLRNGNVAWLGCMGMLLTMLQMGLVAFMVPYLHETFGMGLVQGRYLPRRLAVGRCGVPPAGRLCQ